MLPKITPKRRTFGSTNVGGTEKLKKQSHSVNNIKNFEA